MVKRKEWTAGEGLSVVRVIGNPSAAYLVTNGSLTLLVDTGPSSSRLRLQRSLCALGVERIDWIALTHSHYDHAGNARWARERYGARVIVHRAEARSLADGASDEPGVRPVGSNPLTRFVTDTFPGRIALGLRFEPCSGDVVVDEEYDLSPLGLDARIIHTPGHSSGSMSVIVGSSVALSGDAIFGVFPGSIFPPFASDIPALVRSWGTLLDTSCSVFLPAHGGARGRDLLEREYSRRLPFTAESETDSRDR